MIFRNLIHLVLLSVFLFGSTFSCTAFFSEEVGHSHENTKTESHDCCPKDGHKKQLEGKNIGNILQKQSFESETLFVRNEKLSSGEKIQIHYTPLYYQNPYFDKQSFFFSDTIRLIL